MHKNSIIIQLCMNCVSIYVYVGRYHPRTIPPQLNIRGTEPDAKFYTVNSMCARNTTDQRHEMRTGILMTLCKFMLMYFSHRLLSAETKHSMLVWERGPDHKSLTVDLKFSKLDQGPIVSCKPLAR